MEANQMIVSPYQGTPTYGVPVAQAPSSQMPVPYQAPQYPAPIPQPSAPQYPTTPVAPVTAYPQQAYSQPNPLYQMVGAPQTPTQLLAEYYRSGNSQYLPQEALYSRPPAPVLAPMGNPYLQEYPVYPQTYPQVSGNSSTAPTSRPQIPAEMLEILAATGRLPEGANPQELNPEFATVEKLESLFGSSEVAADWLNRYACTLEDQNEKLVATLNQLYLDNQQAIGIADHFQKREAALVDYMTEPDNVSAYYLQLEKLAGEIDVDGIVERVRSEGRRQRPLGSQGFGQPNSFSQASGSNPGEIAAQYSQAMQTNMPFSMNPGNLRPQMPEMRSSVQGNASFNELMSQVHPSQRWQVIDQLSSQGGFRGSRVVLN